MLPLCADQGIGVIPWSPLARGRLTRDWDDVTERSETDEFGRTLYRSADRDIIERVAAVAAAHGVSRAQVALAWLLAKGETIVPIPGTKRRTFLEENIAAAALNLTLEELAKLDAALAPEAVAGPRYSPHMMAFVDR